MNPLETLKIFVLQLMSIKKFWWFISLWWCFILQSIYHLVIIQTLDVNFLLLIFISFIFYSMSMSLF